MNHTLNHSRNILLIDDDEDDCMFLGQALAKVSDDLTLSCTHHADNLFEVIETSKPSLIIIDFYLPKRSGLDCLKQIKSHPLYKQIPVVMWSTSAVSKNLVAKTQGVQHFFQKPSGYQELVEELKVILLQSGENHDDEMKQF